MNTSFDNYTKREVGEFNPETAAYLYEKENQQQGGYLKLRNPAIRFISRHPWVCFMPALFLLLFALIDKPAVQTQQIPASNGNPVTVNNVFNIEK
jgi:hypothetical protein